MKESEKGKNKPYQGALTHEEKYRMNSGQIRGIRRISGQEIL
jgi:hypothetical protein